MIRRLLLATAVSSALAACAPPPCGEERGFVTSILDGDTIELEDGRKVRYLLVDTPETTGGHNDCYGQEAKAFNASLVDQREVTLRFDDGAAADPSRCGDRFGRLLAYVSVDGVEVNSRLVGEGYACTLFVAPAGTSRAAEFEDLELAARNTRAKLWACETVACQ